MNKRSVSSMTSLVCILLALALLGGGCAQQPAAPAATPPPPKEPAQAVPKPQASAEPYAHTVMIYIVGSDLESEAGAASLDIVEIATAQIAPENHVLLMTGGTSAWMIDAIPTDRTMIYEVGAESFEAVEALPLQNMGSPDTLTGFLEFAHAQYPADSYGLILWDHGAGPLEGVGFDELHEYDGLTLPELRDALAASPFGADNKLEWLGFDACLMSSAEAAYMLSDYADYMIASQETEPGYGWNYAFLEALDGNCTKGDQIGQHIIESYMDYYQELVTQVPNYDPDLTLACLDLGAITEVEAALDKLFSSVDASLLEDIYSQVAQKRNGTKSFGSKAVAEGQSLDLIDIGDLCAQLEDLFPAQVRALEESLGRMVVHNAANVRGANGLSLYYPFSNKLFYQYKWKDDYEALGFAPAYTNFIRDFASIWMGVRLAQWDVGKQAYAAPEADNVFCLQLTPEQVQNYADATYYILKKVDMESKRDAYMMLLASGDVTLDENGLLRAGYDRTMAYMVNETYDERVPCILYETGHDQNSAQYKILAMLSYYGMDISDWSMENAWVYVHYDKQTGLGRITGVTPMLSEEEALHGGKRELDLREWSNAGFATGVYYLTRDDAGQILPFFEWDTTDSIRGWDGLTPDNGSLHMEKGPINDMEGEYFCMLVVEDTQGNSYASELLPVRLEGDTSVTAYVRSGKDGDFAYDLYGDRAVITAYTGTASRVTIPAALGQQPVTGIGQSAFQRNSRLTEVIIPDTVTGIGAYAFQDCENLQSVILPPKLETLGSSALSGCKSLSALELPYGLKHLESHALSTCTGLTSISIPDTVLSIGNNAFYGCRLREIILGNGVKSIGNHAFEDCSLLTQLTIPDSVEYIGMGVFNGCINMQEIHIPAGVQRIRDGAFQFFSAYSAWGAQSRLARIEVSPENPNYKSVGGVLFDKAGKTLLAYPGGKVGAYAIPAGVERIGAYAFCGCDGLLEISFPPSVKRIERLAFAGCEGIGVLTLPDGLVELGDKAFLDCAMLTDVAIGKNLSRVGEEVFSGCDALRTLTVSAENTWYTVKDNQLVKKQTQGR